MLIEIEKEFSEIELKEYLEMEFIGTNFSEAMITALTLIIFELKISSMKDVHEAISDGELIIFNEKATAEQILNAIMGKDGRLGKYGLVYYFINKSGPCF